MSGRQLEDEDAERLDELKNEIAVALGRRGVHVDTHEVEDDLIVWGPLTDIVAVYLDHRSEIDEELG